MASDLRLPELVVDAGSCACAEHDVRVVVDATPQGAATESQLVVEEGRCSLLRARGWCGPSQPLPLRAIYVLEWGRSNTVRLGGMTALRRFLAAATYRPWLLHSPAEQARYWRLGTEVAQRVPVWELTRPREWQALEWAVDTVAGGSAAGR